MASDDCEVVKAIHCLLDATRLRKATITPACAIPTVPAEQGAAILVLQQAAAKRAAELPLAGGAKGPVEEVDLGEEETD